jgi:hypothetical protein
VSNPSDPDEPTTSEQPQAPAMPDPDTSTPSESEEQRPGLAPVPPSPVTLRVAKGPLAAPVLSRVVQMILARASCPLDRLNDALILCDAISAHAPAYSRDGHISFTLTTDARAIELRVAELSAGGASGLLEDARLPDVGNVIERFSDARRVELAADGAGGEALVLRLDFG